MRTFQKIAAAVAVAGALGFGVIWGAHHVSTQSPTTAVETNIQKPGHLALAEVYIQKPGH